MVPATRGSSTVGRDEIIQALRACLHATRWVRAAWLGGSDASGRTDQLSDVDLNVIVEDARVEELFPLLHEALEELSPIAHRWRMPAPTWHGHEQEFLSLRDAEPWHFLDLLVLELGAPDRFLELERHGRPLVLLDRDGLVQPCPLDRRQHLEKMRLRLAALRERFALFEHFVTKAALRGHAADAAAAYASLVLAPLIELLRMRHAPARYDFGARYLDRDLPPAVRARVDELVFVPSLERIDEYRARAAALFDEQLRALDAGEWRLELPAKGEER